MLRAARVRSGGSSLVAPGGRRRADAARRGRAGSAAAGAPAGGARCCSASRGSSLGRVAVPPAGPRTCVVEVEPGARSSCSAPACARSASAPRRPRRFHRRALRMGGDYALALVRYGEGDWPLWLELEQRGRRRSRARALSGSGTPGSAPSCGHRGAASFHVWPSRARLGRLHRVVAHARSRSLIRAAAVGHHRAASPRCSRWWPSSRPPSVRDACRRRCHLSPRGLRVSVPAPTARTASVPSAAGVDVGLDRRLAPTPRPRSSVQTTSGAQLVPMPHALPPSASTSRRRSASAARRRTARALPPPGVPASLAVLAPRDEARARGSSALDATARHDGEPRRVPARGLDEERPLVRAREPRRAGHAARGRGPHPRAGRARAGPPASRGRSAWSTTCAARVRIRVVARGGHRRRGARARTARAAPERGARHRVSRPTTPGATARAARGSPCAASSASHAASAAAIVVKYGMFASSVCRRSE